jgi:hypothetical protein
VAERDPEADARSDRRTMIVGVGAMVGLIVFGLAFGSRFGATECRRLEPRASAAGSSAAGGDPVRGEAAEALLAARLGDDELAALVAAHGPVALARELPVDGLRRLAPDPVGVTLTGAGALLVDRDGTVLAGASYGEGVEVVGSGSSLYALVVGNVITGQVDALRPLQLSRQGVTSSACVDTSAVGSPLSFVHDARDGLFVGLRTDEDGSESVLELRDPTRGRIWAPPVLLGQAPAGLHGARTSGVIAGDVVVLTRRVHDTDPVSTALLAFDRISGAPRWSVEGDALRAALRAAGDAEGAGSAVAAALAGAPTLRLEVIDTDEPLGDTGSGGVLRLLVTRDVATDALLPPPLHGPFADLVDVVERAAREVRIDADGAVTLVLDLADGEVREVVAGRTPREPTTLLRTADGVWLLLVDEVDGDGLLVRFGG